MSIAFGVDRLAADPALLPDARRVGLATNDAARSVQDAALPARALLRHAGIPVVRLFSAEHGLQARAPDGAPLADARDPLTGLPVVSLYGDRLEPPPESLHDLDAVLFDLPDVGARPYTYAWTLTYLIDACATAGIPLVVLDRPNPLGGALASVEGPVLEPAHSSFVGRHSLPLRHALTLGELARLWQRERRPDADVRVIMCEGWRRDLLWPDTGLPWTPPSPGLPTFEAALLYPGLVLFEATNLSVGRGTSLSFEAVGAPWLDAPAVIARMEERALPGIMLEPARFTPTIGPHAGCVCNAVAVLALDPGDVRPVSAGLSLLADVACEHPHQFRWQTYPTAANPTGGGHLERLAGTGGVRLQVERAMNDSGPITPAVLARLTGCPGWAERWQAVRLYQ
jgi:uncharacterized protein YbbC (DUF1343 family)